MKQEIHDEGGRNNFCPKSLIETIILHQFIVTFGPLFRICFIGGVLFLFPINYSGSQVNKKGILLSIKSKDPPLN